jgi:hypothetical protein
MYGLVTPGFPIDKVQVPPVHDPLAIIRYSCVHWIDHFCASVLHKSMTCDEDLKDDGSIFHFLLERYLYWLEALSLCKSVSKGVASMANLEALVQACVVQSK